MPFATENNLPVPKGDLDILSSKALLVLHTGRTCNIIFVAPSIKNQFKLIEPYNLFEFCEINYPFNSSFITDSYISLFNHSSQYSLYNNNYFIIYNNYKVWYIKQMVLLIIHFLFSFVHVMSVTII